MATVNGTIGDDNITTGADDDEIYGGDGNDVLTSGDGNDSVSGGSGSDNIYAGSGADTVDGGINSDYIHGEGGDDTLSGGIGADSIYGGTGNDIIYGDEYDDLIQGDQGDDTLFGGSGDDTYILFGFDGTDTIDGGFGHDTITLYSDADVTITYTNNSDATYSQNGGTTAGTFTDIEEINTAGGNDTIDVSLETSGQTISSGAGNDTIYGSDKNDLIFGGSGDDLLFGGRGDDTFTLGGGYDTVGLSTDSGDDIVYGFDIGDDDTDGAFNSQLDVSGLQNPDGSPVTTSDVVVDTDGNGNAKLVFPEGESIVLDGITPAQISSASQLHAAGIPCFTPGALIATNHGERAVEQLAVGDLVFTRDHGLQPIRWIGRKTVAATGRFAPICLKPGVIVGQDRLLRVSPQHRFLFQGFRAELLFGETEVFVAAKHLVDDRDVYAEPGGQVTYIHLLFDHHEVIYANGAATESFHPGDQTIDSIDPASRAELFVLFPELRADLSQYGGTARRCLKRHESMMVRQDP